MKSQQSLYRLLFLYSPPSARSLFSRQKSCYRLTPACHLLPHRCQAGKSALYYRYRCKKNKQSKCLRVKCRMYGELTSGRKPPGCGAGIASRCCRHGRRSLLQQRCDPSIFHDTNGKEGLFSCPDSPSSPLSTPVSVWLWPCFSPMSLPSRPSLYASLSASCRSPSTARCTAP